MLKVIKVALSFLDRRERQRMNGLFLLMLASSTAEGLGIGILFPFVKLVGDPALVLRVPYLPEAGAVIGLRDPIALVVLVSTLIVLAFFAKNALLMMVVAARTRFIYRNQAAMATGLLSSYMRAPYTWHATVNSSRLIHAVQAYPDVVFGLVLQSFLELATELSALVIILGLLLVVSPTVVLTLTALLGASALLAQRYFPRRMAGLAAEFHAATIDSIRTIQESLGSIKELQVLGRTEFFVERFTGMAGRRARAQARQETLRWLPREFIEVTLALGLVVAAVFLLLQASTSEDIMSVLAVFAAAAFRAMPSLNRIIAATNLIHTGAPVIDELAGSARELLTPPAAKVTTLLAHAPVMRRTLRLDGVSYCYPNAERASLSDLTLEIARGASVGVVGPSGAGKTTLVDLVLGVLEPSAGRILVDGEPVHSAAWRRKVGYVPQSVFLVDDTLRRNVALGLRNDEIDAERVARAIDLAQLAPLVAELPGGLDSPVGERGARLSGGQRQRIGIARALYHDPDLIVFDEATSALDTVTERAVDDAVEALHGSKTLLIVAHRLSTVQRCDTVLFLKDGRLVAAGPAHILYETCVEFRLMADLGQFAPEQGTERQGTGTSACGCGKPAS